MGRVRRRVKVQSEKSSYRFYKSKVYYSNYTGLKYFYQGKAYSTFLFITSNGLTSVQEFELEELNLQEI